MPLPKCNSEKFSISKLINFRFIKTLLIILLLAPALPSFAAADGSAISILPIFKGFNYPTTFDFVPNGDVLVGTKSGEVYKVDQSTGAKNLVLDLKDQVNSYSDRGLLTLRVNKWDSSKVLVYYVVDGTFLLDGNSSRDSSSPQVARLSEFTLDGSLAENTNSERVILGTNRDPSCIKEVDPTPDCIPATSPFHNGGGA